MRRGWIFGEAAEPGPAAPAFAPADVERVAAGQRRVRPSLLWPSGLAAAAHDERHGSAQG
ncbi:hypothetical protein [Streptomyces longispororuber]|uniref:hypothetical protein n=1 Tax=Streptomyces longispororuber TaxID=68230 RepID=UPI0021096E3E|nr:hypothetical protein [Streptomyces longispororuber]MCQ4211453.1 hypothetical protein [Streptomyces longispororuber]